jgi:hypothetical protein
MAAQTSLLGAGRQNGAGRILMRVMTISAGNLAFGLSPAIAILQRSDLIGYQQIRTHWIFDEP